MNKPPVPKQRITSVSRFVELPLATLSSSEVVQHLLHNCPAIAEQLLQQIRPILTGLGQQITELGQSWPTFGQRLPRLAKSGPHLADVGQRRPTMWPQLTTVGRCRLSFGQVCPNSAPICKNNAKCAFFRRRHYSEERCRQRPRGSGTAEERSGKENSAGKQHTHCCMAARELATGVQPQPWSGVATAARTHGVGLNKNAHAGGNLAAKRRTPTRAFLFKPTTPPLKNARPGGGGLGLSLF